MTINDLSYMVEDHINDTVISINDDIADLSVYESYLINNSAYFVATEGETINNIKNDITKIIEAVKEKVKSLGSQIKSILEKVMNTFKLIFDSVAGNTRRAYNRNLVKAQCKYLEECSGKIVKNISLEAFMSDDYVEEFTSNDEFVAPASEAFENTKSALSSIKNSIENNKTIKGVRAKLAYSDYVNNAAKISALKNMKNYTDEIEFNPDYSEMGRKLGNQFGYHLMKATNGARAKLSGKRVEQALINHASTPIENTATSYKYWYANDDKDIRSQKLVKLEDENKKNVQRILESIGGRAELCKNTLDKMHETFGVEYPLSAVLDPNGNGTISNMTIAEANKAYYTTYLKCTKYISSEYKDLQKKSFELEKKFSEKLFGSIKSLFTIIAKLIVMFGYMISLMKSSRGITLGGVI